MHSDLRTVVVLNKKLDAGRMLNATGHLTLALAMGMPEPGLLYPEDYKDADGGIHPAISRHPLIVLRAKSSSQLRQLRAALHERGIFCTDFTHTMVNGGSDAQRAATGELPEDELEYYGVCTFGHRVELDPLTRKFSLVR
ncbi:DUF2000 domain-containing protein [Streptomyces sp. NPDC001404]|uniref:DUF2000 domain-containing protein n=1 Tax=Streptomyces sp. NPDC001404 TaxID=3364571 RepID=UPI003679BD3C